MSLKSQLWSLQFSARVPSDSVQATFPLQIEMTSPSLLQVKSESTFPLHCEREVLMAHFSARYLVQSSNMVFVDDFWRWGCRSLKCNITCPSVYV
ncbi:hypothetical protein K1719_016940 [Acacia pycnantha]|nr:hypothetical protein K1719_016940 [Acacia pycnantha]